MGPIPIKFISRFARSASSADTNCNGMVGAYTHNYIILQIWRIFGKMHRSVEIVAEK